MKKYGFTLIEVLITLAIIGVIAALTLPNFISSYQDRVYITSIQRVYNQLSNSIARYMYDNGVDNTANSTLNTQNGVTEFMQKYMRSKKTCYYPFTDCLPDTYRGVNNSGGTRSASNLWFVNGRDACCYVLESGATVCMTKSTNYPTSDADGNFRYRGEILIDTNGKKDPNTNGRDLFYVGLLHDGSLGSYYPNVDCQDWSVFCLMKIIADGWQMNY